MSEEVQEVHHIINDPAFQIIPKNSTFFLIWRVEKLKLVPLPKADYGKFYNGDSYIVACATEYKGKGDSQMESKLVTGELYGHIHFWIGSKSTQDEAGVAAIKTMEMDDYLGGSPVQHRETEGYESQRFLSYFKNGIRLLVGGVGSGFRKVDFKVKPVLYHVKGKRNPIVTELTEINWLPFNDGDIFILATGKYIFLWTGKHANNMEKIQGIKVAEAIKAEHNHYVESIVIVDDDEEELDMSYEELQAFEEYLPLAKKVVDPYDPKEDETKYESAKRSQITLYRCTEENGSLKINKVKNGPLFKKDLDSNDTFIIDNNGEGIWVWVGKKASRKERSGAMKYANELIKTNNYSQNIRISKVIEDTEHIEFKSLFKTWVVEKVDVNFGKPYLGRISKAMNKSFDATKLSENHTLSAETQLVDNGNGKKEIFIVQNSDLLPLKTEDYGKFYKENCYLIVYNYGSNNVIIYYWFGSKTSNDERNIAESKAFEMDQNQYGDKSVLVRVIECSEPHHLMLIFHGFMTIYKGRYDSDEPMEKCLLQVKGTTEYNTKSVEVDCRAYSLNSNCVFILSLPDRNYIWSGKRSLCNKREMAKKIALREVNKETQLISEGEESDEFWNGLTEKQEFETTKDDKLIHEFQMARLFQRKRGKYEEVVHFDQHDLIEDDLMILDAFDVVFIWLGSKIQNRQSLKPVKIAEDYIKNDVSERDLNLPVYVIKQDSEPNNFAGFFGKWNINNRIKTENFDDLKREMRKLFIKKFPNQ